MSSAINPALGLLIVIAILILGAALLYNGLIRLRNQAKNAWAQIDVQLKRRHDLIPNLVEAVKGYMAHERETLEGIARARNLAQQASGVKDQSAAESKLSSSISKLFAVAEKYPDLKANQNFLALQEEIVSTENRIGFARQFYNDAVMMLNTKIQTVPSNIIAGMFGFRAMEMFEIEDASERAAPNVSFN